MGFRVFFGGLQKKRSPGSTLGGYDPKQHLEIIFHAFLGIVTEYGGLQNQSNLF